MIRGIHRHGLTLVETLITMALVGVFLVILSDLTIGLGRASVQSSQRAQTIELMQSVLDGMRRDVMIATKIVEPAAGSSSARLVLERLPRSEISPSPTSARLPDPVPRTYRWSAVDPKLVQTVTYSIAGSGDLERSLSGGATESLGRVKELAIVSRDERVYEVRLVVEESLRTHTFKTVVQKW